MSATIEKGTFDRTSEQRLVALEHANEIRSMRAQLKRDLKAGRVSVLSLLADPPEWLLSMKVLELLLAVPKYGRVKSLDALRKCGVSPSPSLGALSDRQRVALRDFIASRLWR